MLREHEKAMFLKILLPPVLYTRNKMGTLFCPNYKKHGPPSNVLIANFLSYPKFIVGVF